MIPIHEFDLTDEDGRSRDIRAIDQLPSGALMVEYFDDAPRKMRFSTHSVRF